LSGSAASDPSRRGERTARCNAGLSGRESYPVNCLTFQQARRYCEWRGGRLPTRAEWELATTPGHAPALDDLGAGLSEWTVEPPPSGVAGGRERSVVLGSQGGPFASASRLATSANAQGKGVGFRCVVRMD
jgi:formylglycine-generating enzyme required for sulfatase activity